VEEKFLGFLPSGFQIVGDIAIVSLRPEVVAHKD